MEKEYFNHFFDEYKKRKNEFNLISGKLQEMDILNHSAKQFKDFNNKLRELDFTTRAQIIKNIIIRLIYLKLRRQGFDSNEIENICRQIEINWNLVIDNDEIITVQELIDEAKECWNRKEKKLMVEIENVNQQRAVNRNIVIGSFRLIAVGLIFASDTSMLIKNPNDQIFLSSFWAGSLLFFQGIDNFFKL